MFDCTSEDSTWVEGDYLNEASMKVVVILHQRSHSFIVPNIDDQPRAHLGFALRPSWF